MPHESFSPDRARQLRLLTAAAGALATVALLAGCVGGGPGETVEPTVTETLDPTVTSEPETVDAEPTETPAETEATAPTETAVDSREAVTVALVGAEATSDGGIEIRSFVSDYIGEGECKVTAVAEDGTEWASVTPALPDAQSTVCPTTTIGGLAAGTYSVTVTFENETHRGVSEAKLVEVSA